MSAAGLAVYSLIVVPIGAIDLAIMVYIWHRVRPTYSPKRKKIRRLCSRAMSIFLFSFSSFFHDENYGKIVFFTLLNVGLRHLYLESRVIFLVRSR